MKSTIATAILLSVISLDHGALAYSVSNPHGSRGTPIMGMMSTAISRRKKSVNPSPPGVKSSSLTRRSRQTILPSPLDQQKQGSTSARAQLTELNVGLFGVDFGTVIGLGIAAYFFSQREDPSKYAGEQSSKPPAPLVPPPRPPQYASSTSVVESVVPPPPPKINPPRPPGQDLPDLNKRPPLEVVAVKTPVSNKYLDLSAKPSEQKETPVSEIEKVRAESPMQVESAAKPAAKDSAPESFSTLPTKQTVKSAIPKKSYAPTKRVYSKNVSGMSRGSYMDALSSGTKLETNAYPAAALPLQPTTTEAATSKSKVTPPLSPATTNKSYLPKSEPAPFTPLTTIPPPQSSRISAPKRSYAMSKRIYRPIRGSGIASNGYMNSLGRGVRFETTAYPSAPAPVPPPMPAKPVQSPMSVAPAPAMPVQSSMPPSVSPKSTILPQTTSSTVSSSSSSKKTYSPSKRSYKISNGTGMSSGGYLNSLRDGPIPVPLSASLPTDSLVSQKESKSPLPPVSPVSTFSPLPTTSISSSSIPKKSYAPSKASYKISNASGLSSGSYLGNLAAGVKVEQKSYPSAPVSTEAPSPVPSVSAVSSSTSISSKPPMAQASTTSTEARISAKPQQSSYSPSKRSYKTSNANGMSPGGYMNSLTGTVKSESRSYPTAPPSPAPGGSDASSTATIQSVAHAPPSPLPPASSIIGTSWASPKQASYAPSKRSYKTPNATGMSSGGYLNNISGVKSDQKSYPTASVSSPVSPVQPAPGNTGSASSTRLVAPVAFVNKPSPKQSYAPANESYKINNALGMASGGYLASMAGGANLERKANMPAEPESSFAKATGASPSQDASDTGVETASSSSNLMNGSQAAPSSSVGSNRSYLESIGGGNNMKPPSYGPNNGSFNPAKVKSNSYLDKIADAIKDASPALKINDSNEPYAPYNSQPEVNGNKEATTYNHEALRNGFNFQPQSNGYSSRPNANGQDEVLSVSNSQTSEDNQEAIKINEVKKSYAPTKSASWTSKVAGRGRNHAGPTSYLDSL